MARVRSAERLMIAGAIVSAMGIALGAAGSPGGASVAVLAGWLAFVAGIHSFGRARE